MASLIFDIKHHADFIVKAFYADNLMLDYSINSFKNIDHFFDLHVKNGVAVEQGRMSKNSGPIIFAIGSYIGESFIKNIPGTVWVVDEDDPEGEINAAIQFPNGGIVWPMQRTIKRFQNNEESIYAYGYVLLKDNGPSEAETKKQRRKFW